MLHGQVGREARTWPWDNYLLRHSTAPQHEPTAWPHGTATAQPTAQPMAQPHTIAPRHNPTAQPHGTAHGMTPQQEQHNTGPPQHSPMAQPLQHSTPARPPAQPHDTAPRTEAPTKTASLCPRAAKKSPGAGPQTVGQPSLPMGHSLPAGSTLGAPRLPHSLLPLLAAPVG